MYVGFHLDPLYKVHWNNETKPLSFEIDAPTGMRVTPASGVGPDPEEFPCFLLRSSFSTARP